MTNFLLDKTRSSRSNGMTNTPEVSSSLALMRRRRNSLTRLGSRLHSISPNDLPLAIFRDTAPNWLVRDDYAVEEMTKHYRCASSKPVALPSPDVFIARLQTRIAVPGF
jgi:hypothetical protein